MSVEYTCDGCGKKSPGVDYGRGVLTKPHNWFARGDDDGTQHACSRQCIEKISKTTGKTGAVLPI